VWVLKGVIEHYTECKELFIKLTAETVLFRDENRYFISSKGFKLVNKSKYIMRGEATCQKLTKCLPRGLFLNA